MSEFTYFALWSIVGGMMMGVSALIWWIRREVSRLDTRIDDHDDFVNDTKDVLTDVKVDLASIKANITSMDHSLGDLAKSNRDVTKYMIEGQGK